MTVESGALLERSARDAWRVRALQFVVPVALAAELLSVATSWLPYRKDVWGLLMLVVSLGLTTLALLASRLRFGVRAGSFIAGFALLGAEGVLTVGAAPNAFVVLTGCVLLGALLFGVRGSVVVGVVISALLIVAAIAIGRGWVDRVPGWAVMLDMRNPGAATRIVANFVLANAVIGGATLLVLSQTERLANEATAACDALRVSEERYRGLFDQSPIGIYRTTPDGRIVNANAALVKMLGFQSFEELSSRNLETTGFEPHYSRSEFKARIERDGAVLGLETAWSTRDGRVRYLRENAVAIRGPDERVEYYDGTVEDITEGKAAEEARRASESLLRGILDNSQDAYFRADLSGRLVLVSPAAPLMFGYASVEEMLGLPLIALYADPEEGTKVLDEARGMGRLRDRIVEARRKNGSPFWISVNAQGWRDAEGNLSGTEGMVRDITRRQRAEQERRRLEASVAQSDRLASMGLLAAGLAHEINNPLAYTLVNLESLARELPDRVKQLETLRQRLDGEERGSGDGRSAADILDPDAWSDAIASLQEAVTGARKIKDLARGLSTFSRVEADGVAPIDVRDPIESALQIAQNEIKYRARVEKSMGATRLVLANESRLSQVFLNLIVNAAHAIREGDAQNNRIGVRTWDEGADVFAEVTDTGTGIPDEHLPRIFEPFFTTKPVGHGSGLGLSIVRNILTTYGGTIEVASEVGKGTRFLIRLPSTVASVQDEPTTIGAETIPVRGRILVIDDAAGVRGALRSILREHVIIEAHSGDHARAIVSEDQAFDVILCDVMMPNTSGTDLHRWLVEHHPHLAQRLVFMTGGAFTPGAQTYLRSIENPLIQKPFDADAVHRIIGERVRAGRSEKA